MVRRQFDIDARLAELTAGDAGPPTMCIAADGTWHHAGSRIERLELVRLFATALHRAPDGSYWLVTPFEAARVAVADVPFTMVELDCAAPGPAQTIRLRSNLDAWTTLDADHPLVMRPPHEGDTPTPYVTLRPAHGTRLAIEARLLRPVYYELVELAEPVGDELLLQSAGAVFGLGRLDPA